ncbi:MAG: sigma-70 family RNA polymerase sigma factor [Cyclobacteriaceae bacterium]|nr:sigma-70 family RNA polymerase sigma factor [Cyclobacteriaceae bacterium]MCH8514793.1 sigma-70 family RNA polymerase sigma factor [Cyclobacteriaceae bacterium]
MQDTDYIAGIRSRDQSIEDSFYRLHFPMAKAVMGRMDGQRLLDFEDVYQEAVLIFFQKLQNPSWKEEHLTAKLSTYFMGFVTRVAQNHLRKQLRLQERIHSNGLAAEPSEMMEVSFGDENEIDIFDLADSIKSPCGELLKSRYLEGMAYDKIAIALGYKNANMAKKKKGDCMSKLRNRMEKLNLKLSDFFTT